MGLFDNEISPKNALKFIEEIGKLEEVEFFGLVRLLGVKLVDDEKQPREFESVFSDIFDRFIKLPRIKRKEIMNMLKDINKGRKSGLTSASDHQGR